jgi:hypothetical protein
MCDIQYPPNHLECAIHRHVDRLKLQGPEIRIELFQMILVIREAPLISELLEIVPRLSVRIDPHLPIANGYPAGKILRHARTNEKPGANGRASHP